MNWCDCCGEEWESSFFCDVCSNEPVMEETIVPLLSGIEWDYTGDDFEIREEPHYYATCLNCCPGHR